MSELIKGHGSDSARVMLIADGGSAEDLVSGYALTGRAGDKISGFCRAHNLHMSEMWKTCLIKERIDLSKPKENIPLLSDEYNQILKSEINEIKPNIIVPLAELGFNFLTGLQGIRKFRGSVLPPLPSVYSSVSRVIPVLGVYPYINEDQKMEVISRLDFGKIAKNEYRQDPITEPWNLWICKSASSLREFFGRHYSTSPFVVFDIETYFDIPTCISFCFDGLESVTVPLVDYHISIDDRLLMFHEVVKFLNSPIPKVNQNIKFDWRKLDRLGIHVENVSGDTLLSAAVLYCEFPKNLGFLTSLYTDMPYFKDEGKEWDPSIKDRSNLYLYCAKDSLATHQIHTQQQEEHLEKGTKFVYDSLIQILPIYKRIEDRGILVDDTRRQNLTAEYWNLYEIQLMKLHKMVGRPVNPQSPKQVNDLVFNELKFTKTVNGKIVNSTDEESLELLGWMGTSHSAPGVDANEILKTIVACRKIHKVIEYLESPLHPDKRFRCEYNLGGTETGRSTAGKTTDSFLYFDGKKIKSKNLGRSFQTISKHGFTVEGETYGRNLRSMYVPTPGYVFVECDLSQAEARVDAVLACDYDILSEFDSPTGIHRLTGSWIYGCEPSAIKKGMILNSVGVGEDRYHTSKTVRHAGERNIREDRLVMMLHILRPEAIRILRTFHEKQPNIRDVFHREIIRAVKDTRVLVAPNGRRREFYGRIDDHTINEAISLLPQAIVTDQLKFSLLPTFKECGKWVHPLAEAHDGFLAEVPPERKEEYAAIFKKNVETEIDFLSCTLARDFKLKIPCEAEWSPDSWQNLKKLEF